MPPNRQRDLAAVSLWAFANLFAVLFIDSALIRVIASAPLLLFFTGHAALRAIGPIGASPAERVVYAVGASIAICLAGGFFLNWIGWLTPLGWALWLVAATSVATGIALRKDRTTVPIRFPDFRWWQVTTIAVAALVTYGAYALAVRDEARQRQFAYTEFWMVPTASAAPGRVVIGIKSAEAKARRFDVEVRLDGATVALWRSITVEPGATWTRQMLVAPGAERMTPAHPHKAEALLYEPAGNALYRHVSTIIPGA